MIHWGKMDWSLIGKHQKFLDQWRRDIKEKILTDFNRMQRVRPAVYICGYDYPKTIYQESYHPIDLQILQSDEHKFRLYQMMHNIEALLPFQPLGFIMATDMIITRQNSDEEMKGAVITYQTRLTAKRDVYLLEPVHDGNWGELRYQLKLEPEFSKIDLGPEVAMFESVFPLDFSSS